MTLAKQLMSLLILILFESRCDQVYTIVKHISILIRVSLISVIPSMLFYTKNIKSLILNMFDNLKLSKIKLKTRIKTSNRSESQKYIAIYKIS